MPEFGKEIAPGHQTFPAVFLKLKSWLKRFCLHEDEPLYHELVLFYLLATKKFLDHRKADHTFRLVLAIYFLQKKLQHLVTFSPHVRHLKIRWLPTELNFPFSSKGALGCLFGFNIMDRYELFDEENIQLLLDKHYPHLRIVADSFYEHNTVHKDAKIFYFELEKKNGELFSFTERKELGPILEMRIKNSIQHLSPAVFTSSNEEEIYKTILTLSREIESVHDLPQVYISLDQNSTKDIAFRIILVYIAPYHRLSLKDRFFDCSFISERVTTVRHLDNRPIEAQIFRLILPRDPASLRSDNSIDFHIAREKVVKSIRAAIGDFRDFNGGILVKQQELFGIFKAKFQEEKNHDPEFLARFFYRIMPLEKRIILQEATLFSLFSTFSDVRQKLLPENAIFIFNIVKEAASYFITVRSDYSLNEVISPLLQEQNFRESDLIYNFIDTTEGSFFNASLKADSIQGEAFIKELQKILNRWQQNKRNQKVLRIGAEFLPYSLDPRVGGEEVSSDFLRMLFEGLTRYDSKGNVENAIAESIEISSNLKQYTFKLRPSTWNDGSPVTAYDFEYAWKKILTPSFETAFASFFYPIKNAKEAKDGAVNLEQVGIEVIDGRTLRVELTHPAPSFLQWIVHPVFSPIHRLIDQSNPEWPYRTEQSYPCNGPFQLKINHSKLRYQLIKNPMYWDVNKVSLDQVIVKQMNPYQAFQAFQKNELDWIGNPLGRWHSFYTIGKEDRLHTFPNRSVCWNLFNTSTAPFNNIKLRKAISLVIDRAKLCHQFDSPAFSLVLSHLNSQSTFFPDVNIEKAKQLFAEAKQELNISGTLSIPLIFLDNVGQLPQIMRKQLSDHLEIDCRLQPLSWNEHFSKITAGDFQMGLMHWTSRVDDPIYTLNAFRFKTEEINFSKWENPEFQHCLNLAENEINPFQRSLNLLQAEKILAQEVPALPLFYQSTMLLLKKGLQVSFRSPSGPFTVAYTCMEEQNVYDFEKTNSFNF